MKFGYIYNKTEKQLKQDLEKGEDISLGVDVNSLLETMQVYETISNNDFNTAYAQIKKDLLVHIGRLTIKKDEDNKKVE